MDFLGSIRPGRAGALTAFGALIATLLLASAASASATAAPFGFAGGLIRPLVASPVTRVSANASVTSAGAEAVYRVNFTATDALEPDGYVELTAPAGTVFSSGNGDYAVIDGAHSEWASGGVKVDPGGAGGNVVDVYLPQTVSVAAGNEVEVQAYATTNPTTANASDKLGVSTSSDTTLVETAFPIAAASRAENVHLSATSTTAGSSGVLYSASFEASGAVSSGNPYYYHEGRGFIELTAPAGTVFSSGNGDYAVIDGAHSEWASGGVKVDPGGAGENVVDIYLPPNVPVAAHDKVEVQAYDVSSPSAANASASFSLATSSDVTPVTKAFPIAAASAVEHVSVATDASPAGASRVVYTATFTAANALSNGNADYFHEGASFIRLKAPTGAVFADVNGDYSVSDGQTKVPAGVTVDPLNDGESNVVDLNIPAELPVAAGDKVQVSAYGVQNPSSEDGAATLGVATSSDATFVVRPFPITAPSSPSAVSVQSSDSAAGASRVLYTASFTATDALSNGNSAYFDEAPGFVRLKAPAGTVFAANNGYYEIVDGDKAGIPAGVTVDPDKRGETNVVDINVPTSVPVAAGDALQVRAYGVENPTSPDPSASLSVSTSSDTVAITKSLPITAETSLSDGSVSATSTSASATRVLYTASFTASEALTNGNTGYFDEAPGFIQLKAPAGTVFAPYNAYYDVGVEGPDSVAAGVTVDPNKTGETNVVDIYVPGSHPVGAGDRVEVRAYGVTNPTSEVPDGTLQVSSSADVSALSIPLTIGSATSVGEAHAAELDGNFVEQFVATSGLTDGNIFYFDEAPAYITLNSGGPTLPHESSDYDFTDTSISGASTSFFAEFVEASGSSAKIYPADPINAGEKVELTVVGLAATSSLLSSTSDTITASAGAGSLAPLSGTVLYEGRPVTGAKIEACQANDKECVAAGTDINGNFSLAVSSAAGTRYQLRAFAPSGSNGGEVQAPSITIPGAQGVSGVELALPGPPGIAKGLTVLTASGREENSTTAHPYKYWQEPYELKIERSLFKKVPAGKKILVTQVLVHGTDMLTGKPMTKVVDVGGSAGGLPTGQVLENEPITVDMPASYPIHGEVSKTVNYKVVNETSPETVEPTGISNTQVLDEVYPPPSNGGETPTDPLPAYFLNEGYPGTASVGPGEIAGPDKRYFEIVHLSEFGVPATSTDCGFSSALVQQFGGGESNPPASTECGIAVKFTPPTAKRFAHRIYYRATLNATVELGGGPEQIAVSLNGCDSRVAEAAGAVTGAESCYQAVNAPSLEESKPKTVIEEIEDEIKRLQEELEQAENEHREQEVKELEKEIKELEEEKENAESEEGPESEEAGGEWEDPSGTVYVHTAGGSIAPLAGASVTLRQSFASGGPFTPVPEGSTIMSPANRVNPGTTEASGAFGWDVLPGFYTITATKTGCGSETTPVLTIPPPVSGLSLTLTCTNPPTLTATGTSVQSSTPSSSYGKPVSLTASVSGGVNPTGTVEFKEGAKTLGTAVVVHGAATLTTATLSSGEHQISASYGGDGANAPSVSGTIEQTVIGPEESAGKHQGEESKETPKSVEIPGAQTQVLATKALPKTSPAQLGAVTVLGTRLAVSGSRASVLLRCSAHSTCSGKLTLTVEQTTGKGHNKRAVLRTIGTATFTIRPGGTATVELAINATARKLLSAGHGKLATQALITDTSAGPQRLQIELVAKARHNKSSKHKNK
jgi:Bacterial Ig-like domain (group 3)